MARPDLSTVPLVARRAHTTQPDPVRAVAALAEELEADGASAVLLFCNGEYELGRLGSAIAQRFRTPVAACTAAGQVGSNGFEHDGITGVSLTSVDLRMRPHLLSPLSLCQSQAVSLAHEQARSLSSNPDVRSFGVLLTDGLSYGEEYVASALYEALGNVPLVGGSAAASRSHPRPAVYYEGKFLHDVAVLALFETKHLAFETFTMQHFVPSDTKLVVTLADPDRRVVYELDGEPADRAYARALGLGLDALGPRSFACHPLLLDLGDQLFPRAIRARQADGSLSMGAALEEGLVLSIAQSPDPVGALERTLAEVERHVPDPAALLVFDCVLRRIELEARGLDVQVGELMASKRVVGFSSYGEQLGPLHVNHSFTGVALGSRRGLA
jgi:hypothetical protein